MRSSESVLSFFAPFAARRQYIGVEVRTWSLCEGSFMLVLFVLNMLIYAFRVYLSALSSPN
jgi:hypothetical protein